jgi:hypothetical protein
MLTDTLDTVSKVKNDNPIPKDVVKAADNFSGELVTYHQGFRAIQADKEKYSVTVLESFNLIIPYLKQFKALNEGSEVHYILINAQIS